MKNAPEPTRHNLANQPNDFPAEVLWALPHDNFRLWCRQELQATTMLDFLDELAFQVGLEEETPDTPDTRRAYSRLEILLDHQWANLSEPVIKRAADIDFDVVEMIALGGHQAEDIYTVARLAFQRLQKLGDMNRQELRQQFREEYPLVDEKKRQQSMVDQLGPAGRALGELARSWPEELSSQWKEQVWTWIREDYPGAPPEKIDTPRKARGWVAFRDIAWNIPNLTPEELLELFEISERRDPEPDYKILTQHPAVFDGLWPLLWKRRDAAHNPMLEELAHNRDFCAFFLRQPDWPRLATQLPGAGIATLVRMRRARATARSAQQEEQGPTEEEFLRLFEHVCNRAARKANTVFRALPPRVQQQLPAEQLSVVLAQGGQEVRRQALRASGNTGKPSGPKR